MMAEPHWPSAEERTLIGKRKSRVDGPEKCTGRAKYTYDIKRENMLHVKLVSSRHAHARINALDTSAAERLDGVAAVWREEDLVGGEVQYAGQILAAVAAETEEIARDAVRLVAVDYEVLEPQVDDTNPEHGEGRPASREEGDFDAAIEAAAVVHEGEYGIPVITHCCLEPHGQVSEMRDGEFYLWGSTQSATGYASGLGVDLEVEDDKIHVDCQHMGGGFGAKFSYGKWGVISAKLAKQTGRPVKLMLERDLELMIAGNRPSAYGKVQAALDGDGKITAFGYDIHGTGGPGGYRPPPMPYVFTGIQNTREHSQRIPTNRGGQQAWRAPGHPQGCFLTMAAVDDAAAKLGMDPLEFFKLNAELTERPEVYREQLDIAADMIGYRDKAHARGEGGNGPLKRGLGIGLHMWGGIGHDSECDVILHPDGSVEVKIGSQDLGTGTRTVIGMVVADTLGLPLEAVHVRLGRNAYPPSGGSGGSTTIGGVSSSSLLAASAARDALIERVAREMEVEPGELESREGQIRQRTNPQNAISWQEACSLLGTSPLTRRGVSDRVESQRRGLINAGVGGVQIAEVSVDVETGIVRMKEMVCVQDCGLIINLKLAESQVYGGMIMGITYALFEEALYDRRTGRMLNPDMEFYRLATLKDVGTLKVHMMTGAGHDERGVIGLGEPPVIAPGAAISNAVANAIGVRVPHLPLTPERVIMALDAENSGSAGTAAQTPLAQGGIA